MSRKWRAIQGILFRQYDIKDWNEKQFVSFFEFYNSFMEEDKCVITNAKLTVAEDNILEKSYDPFKAEILYRIDQFVKDPKSHPTKFLRRLNNMVRVIGGYIKKNPSVATEKVRGQIENNPRLNWMTKLYRVAQTAVGDVVVKHDVETVGYNQNKVAPVDDPRVKIAETYTVASDVALKLIKSISSKDIKKLTAMQKFAALQKLAPFLDKMKGFNPNIGTFNQLNIYKSDKDETEKALLDMVNK